MEKNTIFCTPRYQAAISEFFFFFLKADIFLTAIYASLCRIFTLKTALRSHVAAQQQLTTKEVVEPPMCRKMIYVNIHITSVLQQEVQLQHV